MRVIIAGGSGMIGQQLTRSFINSGDEVVILSRNPAKVSSTTEAVKVVQWDGKTVQEWAGKLENADICINLTGENLSGTGFLPSRWTKDRKLRLVDSRVNSGKVLSEAIRQAIQKPAVFIQASGVGYYGTLQDKILTESDERGNDFSADLCREWEASSQPVEAMGVRRCVIRNGVVLSTKGGAFPLLLLPYKLWMGGRMGSGKQVYSWIHIDDEVNAIRFLIKNQQSRGTYNLSAPNPVTNDEFGRTIAKVMKRPHYFPIPSFVMRLAFGEVAAMVLDGQKVIPKRLLDEGYSFRFPLLEQALTQLLK